MTNLVVHINTSDKTHSEVCRKVLQSLIDGKLELKGRIDVSLEDSDVSPDLLITDEATLAKGIELGKRTRVIVLFDGKLAATTVETAQKLGALGVFPVNRFYGENIEYSEIGRFEGCLKDFFRERLSSRVLESEMYKPIDWKVSYSPGKDKKTISLFSDKAMNMNLRVTMNITDDLAEYCRFLADLKRKIESYLKSLKNCENSVTETKAATAGTKIKAIAKKVSESEFTSVRSILITGPTGAGKTLMANYITRRLFGDNESPNRISLVNIPENLLQSELFGCFPGAFTGSTYKMGKFLASAGGVIFLDEIGEISASVQAKLLTYLDDMRVMIDGYSDPEGVRIPVLIIAATNKNLREEIRSGSFRADLYHRFTHFVEVPSLKERKADFRYLLSFVLQEKAQRSGNTVKRISLKAIEKLESYAYPGNFRELESIVGMAVANAEMDDRDCVLERDISFI